METNYLDTYKDRMSMDLTSIKILDLKTCQFILEECLAEGNFNRLIIMINRIFSSPKNLMQCFKKLDEKKDLETTKYANISKSNSYSEADKIKPEGKFHKHSGHNSHNYNEDDEAHARMALNLNGSLLQRSNSTLPYRTSPSLRRTHLPSINENSKNIRDISKSMKGENFTEFSDPTSQNRPLSMDLEAANAGLTLLFSPESAREFNLPSVILSSLVEAIIGLSFNLEFELKFERRSFELNPDFANVFVLISLLPRTLLGQHIEIFEKMLIHEPKDGGSWGESEEVGGEAYNVFIREALPRFCTVTALIPLRMKSRLVRLWSRMSPLDLQIMVRAIQDCINHRILSGQFGDRRYVNDDKTIVTAVKVLEMLYYASLLAGTISRPVSRSESQQSPTTTDEGASSMGRGGGGSHVRRDDNSATATAALASRFVSNLNNSVDNRIATSAASGTRNRLRSSGLDLINIVWRDFTTPIHIRSNRLEAHLGFRPVDCLLPAIPFSSFTNGPLNRVLIIERDYLDFRFPKSVDQFSFLNHPFVLTTTTKQKGLHLDNRIRMYDERRVVYLQNLLHGFSRSPPFLKFKVRRHRLIEDSLSNLELIVEDNPEDLRKQLIVEFEGETGHDGGGLSKEFFQLVIEQIFNQDFGMFTYNSSNGFFWFNGSSLENWAEYYLIGTIIGLAIYNAVILDVHFPPVLYSKLAGRPGRFADLAQTHPDLHRGLNQLLDYVGDVERDLDLTFRVTLQDVYGGVRVHDLLPNGDSIPVTALNRHEFVDLYADYLLNQSVEEQFAAFYKGFSLVVEESPLHKFFLPHELELLICGSPHYNFHDFEQATTYEGGYSKETPVIRYFWNTVHDMTEVEKSSLLKFATGSDRVPVGGLSNLKLVITRQGSDSDRLPTAHTCFNYLLLPEYESQPKLKERLLKAINHAKGFGLI